MRSLAQQKRRVLALARSARDPLIDDYLEGLNEYIDWMRVDLTKPEQVLHIADRHEIAGLIHAAVFTAVNKETEQSRAKDIVSTNVMGTVNTLELARMTKAGRYVYVSSSGVYGSIPESEGPVKEDSIQPHYQTTLYRITKLTSEKIVQRYSQLFPITATCMRIADPYGAMERPTGSRKVMGAIFSLVKLVKVDRKRTIRVKGFDYASDWTYVTDIVRGIVAGLDARTVSPIYNIGIGINVTVREILTTLQDISDARFECEEVGEGDDADFLIPAGSTTRGPLSIDRAGNELGFHPQYDLKRGLSEYLTWWNHVTKKGLWPG